VIDSYIDLVELLDPSWKNHEQSTIYWYFVASWSKLSYQWHRTIYWISSKTHWTWKNVYSICSCSLIINNQLNWLIVI